MKEDWTDKERELIERLGSVNFKPDNHERLKIRVLSRIQDETTGHTVLYWWARIAAGVLIFFLVSTYAVQEGYTYYCRLDMNSDLTGFNYTIERGENCRNVIQYYLSVNYKYNLISQDRDTLYLSLGDVAFVKDNYPGATFRIDALVNAMKSLYPLDYAIFKSGDVVRFDVAELKNDTRLCELLVNN